MLQLALYEPEIPPNTGNIIRLCANTNTQLHLIEPLGFALDDKKMRRAGLDYREFAEVKIHKSYQAFLECIGNARVFACSTKGKTRYCDVTYQPSDVLLFGPETRGLPSDILQTQTQPQDQVITIPMAPKSRSLNLSNAAAIILYSAWQQLNFRFDVSL